MQPQPFRRGDRSQPAKRIDRPGIGGSRGGDHEERTPAPRTVGPDHGPQPIGVHPEPGVRGHDPDPGRRQAGDPHRPPHAEMGVLGEVDHAAVHPVAEQVRARRGDGRHRGHRSAGGEQATSRRRQPELPAQPAQHALLHGGERGPNVCGRGVNVRGTGQ